MFDFLKKTKKPNPDASKLLASILVVFPAVQSVTYDSKDETLEFSFALNGKFSQEDIENFSIISKVWAARKSNSTSKAFTERAF